VVSLPPAAATDLVGRICDFTVSADLPVDTGSCELEQSEFELPRLCRDTGNTSPVDFVLIDGGHGIPSVFVDLHDSNRLLRTGGLLVLDNANLHSVNDAARMLREPPQFALKADLSKALVFQKVSELRDFGDWCGQLSFRRKAVEYATQPRPAAL
jgi:hypothetical protein